MLDVYQIDEGPSGVFYEVYVDSCHRDNYVGKFECLTHVLDYAQDAEDDFTVHTYAKWYKENADE